MTQKNKIAFLVWGLISLTSWAGPEKSEHNAPQMPKDFDHLKPLIGQWEGISKMGKDETLFTASYELTSGGSAILERLFIGSPHEMVSVYHRDGKEIAMTHYCMLGNQPKMTLKKADPKAIQFEMKGKTGIKSSKEQHMHSLNISWLEPDHVKQEWVLFENGAKKDVTVLDLKRKK